MPWPIASSIGHDTRTITLSHSGFKLDDVCKGNPYVVFLSAETSELPMIFRVETARLD